MKAGRSLVDLATELERQRQSKKDYIADTRRLKMAVDRDDSVVLEGVNGGMPLRPTAHAQLAETLRIPKPYYDRMLAEQPDLLANNVNRWLNTQPAKKLVRTLDNQVRAVLSDSYRPLDNADLAEAVLPRLVELEAQVLSTEITETRFYIKAVTPKIEEALAKINPNRHERFKGDDLIQAGLVVSNSEVGHGAMRIEALDYRLVCYNGLISEVAVRQAHLGRGVRGADAIEDAREYFRTETRIADDKAFFLKVRDAVGAMFDRTRFKARVQKYADLAGQDIGPDPVKAVEAAAKRFSLTEGEKGGVLKHLIGGGDLSRWGLVNAITRAAQDVDSYDRSTELEAIGGDLVALPARDWNVIAA